MTVLGRIKAVTSDTASITGGSVSFTVTVNEPPVVLPATSRAVQATVVIPIGKILGDGRLHDTVTPGALSAAPGAPYVTFAHDRPGSLATATFAGWVTVGGWVSLTRTVKLALAGGVVDEVHVTRVVPTG